MNKSLQLQYDTLSQSISKLDFVVSQFLLKVKDISNQISDQFLKNKKKIKNTKEFYPEIDQVITRDLIAYQDSLIHRFKSSYELTCKFLDSYIQEVHSLKSKSIQELFNACLNNNLLTNHEYNELIKLSNEFENILVASDEISEEIIQYCILMHNVVNKFKITI